MTTNISKSETTVVNLRDVPFDVKICRGEYGAIPPPPEEGCFGNPFRVQEHGRDGAIRLFKTYFYVRIEGDPEFKKAVLSLKGKRLGCHCLPQRCHGEVIKEYLDRVES